MSLGRICFLALAVLALRAQEVRIAVGITPAQNIFNRIQAPFEKATGIKLILQDARSPEAWRLLDEGKVEAASGGLTWEDWLKSIKNKNLRIPTEEEIRRFQIGTDQIQILTHGDTLVLELQREDLKGILSGKITNWKQVGGEDAPIILLLDPTQVATNDTVRGQILGGQPFGPSAWNPAAGANLLAAVAATPNAIGFAPKASQESLKVNSPVTDPITRPILLLIKGSKPTPGIRKLLDYLETPEAQKLVVH